MRENKFDNPLGYSHVPVLARTGHLETDDPFLHEEAVRPVEAICTPLGRRYQFEMQYLVTPHVRLHHASIGAPLRGRGSLPPNMLTLCVPVRLAQGSTFGKSPLQATEIACSIGGALDVVFAEGQTHFVVMIAIDLLRQTLPADDCTALEHAATTLLLPSCSESLKRFANWLGQVLHEVQTHPDMLHFPAAVRSFEEDLIKQLAEAIDCRLPRTLIDRPFSRARGLDRALDYLYSRELNGLSVPALCAAVAVSQRTLERAFQNTFDMSARDYLRIRRLHAVRRELMAASKGKAKVADIAYAHGFYELGRFAGIYARLFGERPSETLGRTFPEPRAVLIGANLPPVSNQPVVHRRLPHPGL